MDKRESAEYNKRYETTGVYSVGIETEQSRVLENIDKDFRNWVETSSKPNAREALSRIKEWEKILENRLG